MKRIQLWCGILCLGCFLSSCKVYPPVYKHTENVWLERIDKDGFKVRGQLILYNPNKVRAKLSDVLMNVELNGKHVVTVGQKVEVPIPAKSEFAIPLNLTIKPDMSLSEGLSNIISMLKTKQVGVAIKGVVVIKALGMKVSMPIDETQKIDLSKLH